MALLRNRVVIAVLALIMGLVMGLGVMAWADIPDDAPSAPDSTQTAYLCYRDSSTPLKSITGVFDRSQGLAQGKPDCRSLLGPGNHTLELVPDAILETND